MAILFESALDDGEVWQRAIKAHFPDDDIFGGADQVSDKSAITIAMVWAPKPGLLKQFPNLKVVCNLGAGVDKLLADPDYPRHVPLVRLIDPALSQGMTEFILHRVLTFFRGFHNFAKDQQEQRWGFAEPRLARDCTVGILGMGELGVAAARRLVSLDFQVRGWSRSLKEAHRVDSFVGPDKLAPFLRDCEILVNLLPLTPDTKGILNADLFAQMPKGAFIINAGRGGHLVDDDLLAALANGQISAAALDVFHHEPLTPDHPFWTHPNILVTPHIASITNPDTATEAFVPIVRDILTGCDPQGMDGVVDMDRGY